MSDTLLRIRGLKTYFYTEEGIVEALDGVNLDIMRGETFGLVGETGCYVACHVYGGQAGRT